MLQSKYVVKTNYYMLTTLIPHSIAANLDVNIITHCGSTTAKQNQGRFEITISKIVVM